jgi:hypothetical protein
VCGRTILLEITMDFMEHTPSRENITTIRQRRMTKTQQAIEHLTSDSRRLADSGPQDLAQLSKQDDPANTLRDVGDNSKSAASTSTSTEANKPATAESKPAVQADQPAAPAVEPAQPSQQPQQSQQSQQPQAQQSPKLVLPAPTTQSRSSSLPPDGLSGGNINAKLGNNQSTGSSGYHSLPSATSAPSKPASPPQRTLLSPKPGDKVGERH